MNLRSSMHCLFRTIRNPRTLVQYRLQTVLMGTAIWAFWLGHFLRYRFNGTELLVLSVAFSALTFVLLLLPLKFAHPLMVGPLACTSLSLLETVVRNGVFYGGPLYRYEVVNATCTGLKIGLICGVLICLWRRIVRPPVAQRRNLGGSWARALACCVLLVGSYFLALGLGERLERRKWTHPGANLTTYSPAPYGHRIVEFRGFGINDDALASNLARHVPKNCEVRMSFFYTQVTDKGLRELESYPGLTEVDLRGTKASAAGVQRLQKVLPGCKIRW